MRAAFIRAAGFESGFRLSLFALLAAIGCAARTASAQNLEFRQISSPPGAVNQTTYPATGSAVSTVTAPPETSGNNFTHWTFNGVRQNNGTGAARNPVPFTIAEPVEAIAHYLPTAQDSDADTLPDWYEIHYFGDLTQDAADDFDGDGFTNADERTLGQHPGAIDERIQGGISRRRGGIFNVVPGVGDPAHVYGGVSRRRSESILVIHDQRLVQLAEISSPVGILSRVRVLTLGQRVDLITAPAAFGDYRYTGWLVNGVRLDRPPQNQPIAITLAGNTTAVVRYVRETDDTDGDGIPDWIEWYHFNSLAHDLTSDPDGDGFTWEFESFRGTSLVAHDQLAQGGISRRRGATLEVDNGSRVLYRLTSAPATILEQSQLVLPGTQLTVPDRTNHTHANYKFAWWDLNGTRMEDASGTALHQFSFVISESSTATANYVDPVVDSDGDGIADWYERFYYGTLARDGAADSDGDGFTFAQELTDGQSPRVVDTRAPGGISRRRGISVPVNAVLLQGPPIVVVNAASDLTHTTATLSALINPLGSPTTAYFEFGQSSAYGEQSDVAQLGSGYAAVALAAQVSGLQPGKDYHFRVVATNAHGTSLSDDVTFRIRTSFETWAASFGVGGPLEDDDRDGKSNLLEYATGAHPREADASAGEATTIGDVMEFRYRRLKAALFEGIQFVVEWSDTLAPQSWNSSGIMESVTADDGAMQEVVALIPIEGAAKRFVRLRVSEP